jgi:hypothetical protein
VAATAYIENAGRLVISTTTTASQTSYGTQHVGGLHLISLALKAEGRYPCGVRGYGRTVDLAEVRFRQNANRLNSTERIDRLRVTRSLTVTSQGLGV